MTLREELEILRGEPIQVFTGDPMDIPCIETSDPEKLCKHPIVSVHMITYNHESFIRQAIEGVMMQKTDFEFELVIGDDASTDKTREICFEYQRRHPDKIRILWWHENLYQNHNKSGGNFQRVTAHCRGEFVAFCEGDDYWIDSSKLQKQVDVLRSNSSIAVAFSGGKILKEGIIRRCDWFDHKLSDGLITGKDFFTKHLTAVTGFMLTASSLVRRSTLQDVICKFELMSFRLSLCDTIMWLGLSALGEVWFDSSEMVVYRRHSGGITGGAKALLVGIDAALVRMVYDNLVNKRSFTQSPFIFNALDCRLAYKATHSLRERVSELGHIIMAYWRYRMFWHIATQIDIFLFLIGKLPKNIYFARQFLDISHKFWRIPHAIVFTCTNSRTKST